MVTRVTSVELSVPAASTPKFVLASEALLAPVPPSAIARVPVIEEAPRSTAISVDSITSPPFAFKSAEIVKVSVALTAAVMPSPPVNVIVFPLAMLSLVTPSVISNPLNPDV